MNILSSFLLQVSTTITPSAGGAATTTAEAAQSSGGFFGSVMSNPIGAIVAYLGVLFVVMYFFSIRPTKKREQKMYEMRNALSAGDSVLLNSGMYGKIVDVTAECFIVEFGTNKGIRIPVLRSEVAGKAEPNLSNKVAAPPAEEPKKGGLFGGFGKKKEEEEAK